MIFTGIWLDHRKAYVVQIENGKETIHTVLAEHDAEAIENGGSKTVHDYTSKDFVPEDRLERKDRAHANRFFDELIAGLHNVDVIHIMGPGEAKLEFKKRIEWANIRGHIAPLETMDKMTDRQIAAHVRELASTVKPGL